MTGKAIHSSELGSTSVSLDNFAVIALVVKVDHGTGRNNITCMEALLYQINLSTDVDLLVNVNPALNVTATDRVGLLRHGIVRSSVVIAHN
jgi:hypothetical protein